MSTYLFLKEEIKNFTGFRTKASHNDPEGHMFYNDRRLFRAGNVLAMNWTTSLPVPDDIAEFVIEVTHDELTPATAQREFGVYKLRTATCELMPDLGSIDEDGPNYRVKISAKNTEDIRELIPMVLGGLIHPDISYERPTSGLTRQQLIDKAEELRILNNAQGQSIAALVSGAAKLQTKLQKAKEDLEAKSTRLTAIFLYVRSLETTRMFWSTRKVVNLIIKHLDAIGNPPEADSKQ